MQDLGEKEMTKENNTLTEVPAAQEVDQPEESMTEYTPLQYEEPIFKQQ